MIRGEVCINSSVLDDKVLYKSADELPTYHLANVVDDHLMEILTLFAVRNGYHQIRACAAVSLFRLGTNHASICSFTFVVETRWKRQTK